MKLKTVRYFLLGISFLFSLSTNATPFSFVALGDQPYGPPETLETLIQTINQDKDHLFLIHVGDIKSGGARCDDSYYLKIKDIFNLSKKPLIYTPGDNEWTDCHRKNNGGYEPLERLNKLREVFFSDNKSLGQQKLILQKQSNTMQNYAAFVENNRWTTHEVMFITINQPGSNNNRDSKVPGAIDEYTARNEANMAWLKSSFKAAKNKKAIVVAMQSDTTIVTEEVFGFDDFLKTIKELAVAYKKPVLIIQGDTHQFLVDRIIQNEDGKPIANVLRMIVPGDKSLEAVKVEVDTKQNDILKVFHFTRIPKTNF